MLKYAPCAGAVESPGRRIPGTLFLRSEVMSATRLHQYRRITMSLKLKIEPIGKIWKSEANGWVYWSGGLSPTICVGAHSGVQPKILIIEEDE